MRRQTVLIALALVVLAASCGGGDEEPATTTGATATPDPAVTSAAPPATDSEQTPPPPPTSDAVTTTTEGDVGKYPSLAFDALGRAHISYFYQDGQTSGTIRHAVSDGNGWTVTDVASLDAFEINIARRNSSLAIDSAGVAHLAFSDTTGVWYADSSEGGWNIQRVASAGSLPLGQLVSLVLDGNDAPHIAFYEITRENPLDGVVLYTTPG